jgi:hypothetical protein
MSVSGTPQRPKPPHSSVTLEGISPMAAEADGRTLLMRERREELEKRRAWLTDFVLCVRVYENQL